MESWEFYRIQRHKLRHLRNAHINIRPGAIEVAVCDARRVYTIHTIRNSVLSVILEAETTSRPGLVHVHTRDAFTHSFAR